MKASYAGRKMQNGASNSDGAADGIIIDENNNDQNTFIKSIAQHRFWEREMKHKVPA